MKLSKLGVLCAAFMTLALASCGQGKEDDNTVNVFILSGQSNMEVPHIGFIHQTTHLY